MLAEAQVTLLEYRARRIPPALDDKVLLGWNALMNLACSKAYAALGDQRYRDMAIANMAFIKQKLKGEGIYFYYHSYKGEGPVSCFSRRLCQPCCGPHRIAGDHGRWELSAGPRGR